MSNSRVIHLLTCLANNLIKMDMPYIDINEIHQAIKQTYFYPVFKIIFKSQKCNKRYTQIFVKNLIDELISYSKNKILPSKREGAEEGKNEPEQNNEKKDEEIKSPVEPEAKKINDSADKISPSEKKEENEPGEMKQIELIVGSPGAEQKNGEEGNNNMDDNNPPPKKDTEELKEKPFFYAFNLEIHPSKEKQKYLKDIMKKLTAKMAKSLNIGEQQSDRLEERTFSCEIIWLLQKVKKALVFRMNKDKNEEEKPFFESQIASLIICNHL